MATIRKSSTSKSVAKPAPKTTAARKTTATRKPAAAPKTPARSGAVAAKTTAAPSAPANAAATQSSAPELNIMLRKKQLLDRAVLRSGVKRKYAKPAIEAALEVLGEALTAGEDLNLPPMGKLKIQREMDKPNAVVYVARIRRPKAMMQAKKDPLAEAAE